MRDWSRWRGGRWVWSFVAGRRSARWRSFSDRGSATVWTVGAITVLCAVFGAVLAMGQAVVVRHRAAGAADLAALAAADHWRDGGAAACARADRVARAQSARLVRCAVEGQISDVTTASGTGPLIAEVRSRAGPPGSPGLEGPAEPRSSAGIWGAAVSAGPVVSEGPVEPAGSAEPAGRVESGGPVEPADSTGPAGLEGRRDRESSTRPTRPLPFGPDFSGPHRSAVTHRTFTRSALTRSPFTRLAPHPRLSLVRPSALGARASGPDSRPELVRPGPVRP
jgi:secretion/DNA translocation related TadE-like protein